ncbi:aminotransferase class V-fold PLP-dependent enzyme [Cellulosilyticum sp. I15G10I2]|uniref:aminotransferase class V-fold PLP-dependent enzyme n=1 Tax=Cellulosilyticum sp. I15G10I2 TaxID=1892843 RepID=UPI000A7F7AE7
MKGKNVYIDYAATTPVKPEVFKAMLPYFNVKYGNASSIYSLGRNSKDAICESREKALMQLGLNQRRFILLARE